MVRSLARWGSPPVFGFVLAACGSSGASGTPIGQPVSHGDAAPDAAGREASEPTPDASCAVAIEGHPIEGNLHMQFCSPLTFGTNPPSSGNHYPTWAAYRTYAQTFLPGFWVHSLEHGA